MSVKEISASSHVGLKRPMESREITKDLPTKKKKHKPCVSHQFTSVKREIETEKMAKKNFTVADFNRDFFR